VGIVKPMPGAGLVKRLPIFRILAVAQLAMLAGEHARKLSPDERKRLVDLVRRAKGRPKNLRPKERDELRSLVSQLEPGAFARGAASRLSPIGRGRKK